MYIAHRTLPQLNVLLKRHIVSLVSIDQLFVDWVELDCYGGSCEEAEAFHFYVVAGVGGRPDVAVGGHQVAAVAEDVV